MISEERSIPISEIFGPTIQGEGPLLGAPTIFVRTGGCDYRCSWCDTLYAVLPEHREEWTKMSVPSIIGRVKEIAQGFFPVITISGGNPAIHDLTYLIRDLRMGGFDVAVETQASIAREWFTLVDYLILSPKPPSSGNSTQWSKVVECLSAAYTGSLYRKTSIKIVVFDDQDFEYATRIVEQAEDSGWFKKVNFFLQVGNPFAVPGTPLYEEQNGDATDHSTRVGRLLARQEWLSQKVIESGWAHVKVLPQLHVLMWGNKRGV